MMQRILTLGIALLLGLPGGAQSQNTDRPSLEKPPAPPAQATTVPQPQGPPIIVPVEQVLVPVTVKNGDGLLVGDLQRDEFRVFVDGIEQRILGFTSDPFPLSAVILIDSDLPQKPGEQVQKSLTTISAGFGPNDEAALVTYSEYPTTVQDFSTNNDDLFAKLKRLDLGTHTQTAATGPASMPTPVINGNTTPGNAPATGLGIPLHGAGRYQTNTALNDALYAAADMLKSRGHNRRRIVFLISDGTNSRQNQHGFNETLHSLLASDVSVYSISVAHMIPAPVGKSIIEKGLADLQKYSANTGGDTFYSAKQEELERLYSDVTEEARNQYTLTFQPSGIDRAHDYHPIEVRVRRPGLSILARGGYYQSAIGVGH